ncbi:MAG: hypothetical protein CBB68_10115 [Rhodospirillaceae bacterium TMED8]|nr:cell division protein ZapA [Magnetovibrio sp.]OUT50208.1 MAG: hypothetical protein CBB68_10115 [Rhodospirillaceae bacterium TMED8]
MAQVSVEINGRAYQITCDDGQEAHLRRLGGYINNRVRELVAAVGEVGDSRLLVMVSLLIADELSDAYAELGLAKRVDDVNKRMDQHESLSVVMENLAERIEYIAETLEAT